MKATELMLGSVLERDTLINGWKPYRVDWIDVSQNDWEHFLKVHRPIPLTSEIFERCPLPDLVNVTWYSRDNLFCITTKITNWYGTHVHTLQMFLRSVGLEWDLSNLFKND